MFKYSVPETSKSTVSAGLDELLQSIFVNPSRHFQGCHPLDLLDVAKIQLHQAEVKLLVGARQLRIWDRPGFW